MSLVKDIILSIAAIITAVVAIKGLKIWRRQLKGTTEYQIALKLLEKVYRLQDAIRIARFAFVSLGELSQRPCNPEEDQREQHVRDEWFAFSKRLEVVDKAKTDLKLVNFEAMALWNDSETAYIQTLIQKTHQLYSSIHLFFSMQLERNRDESINKIINKHRFIVYGDDSDEDKYAKEVDEIIKSIEAKFRKYVN